MKIENPRKLRNNTQSCEHILTANSVSEERSNNHATEEQVYLENGNMCCHDIHKSRRVAYFLLANRDGILMSGVISHKFLLGHPL